MPLSKSRADKDNKRRSHKSTISIDRVDSEKGYTKDNVELVCYGYNTAKSRFTSKEFEELCKMTLIKAGYTVLEKEKGVHCE